MALTQPRDEKGCFEKATEEMRDKVAPNIYVLERLMRAPFEEKLARARSLVREAITRFGDKTAVSCSFGKDSTVVLYLAREVDPDIKVIFCNTGVEYPETIRFKDRLVEEWDLNLLEGKPDTTFWKIVEEHGYPDIRYRWREPKCCEILRIKPMAKIVKEHELLCTLTGLSADESYQRKWMFIWYGDHYQMKKRMPWPLWKYHPIGYWRVDEVWQFIRDEDIPMNEIYQKIDRVGCMPCTSFTGWEEKLGRTNLKLLRRIGRDIGRPRLEEFLDA